MMGATLRTLTLAAALMLAAGCDDGADNGAGGGGAAGPVPAGAAPAGVVFHAEGNPGTLSAWGVLPVVGGRLTLADGVLPYELATPLFTDHAGKLRTVWLPPGSQARYEADKVFDFPVGTVITKTFYYPKAADGVLAAGDLSSGRGADGLDLAGVRLIETRVLVHRQNGWVALPYVWDADQKEARLQRTGAVIPLSLERPDGQRVDFPYVVPNANQCGGCHVDDLSRRAMQPIGPKARHLNISFGYADGVQNQLARWQAAGILEGAPAPDAAPRNAGWRDESQPVEARARAYLDINCGHCHSPVGPAKTSGMHLTADVRDARVLGLCKPPVAAGQGTGGNVFGIVPGEPDKSILVYRMTSLDPGAMMPELGRSLTHDQGIALIRQWVAGMQGSCAG